MDIKRKLGILACIMAFSFGCFAQGGVFGVPNLLKYDKQLFHFGFSLSYNQSNFRISTTPDLPNYDTISLMKIQSQGLSDFGLGIVTNLRLGKYFDLRFIPGFSFGNRYVNYYIKYPTGNEVVTSKECQSVYLDLPILFKYKSSRMLNNVRAYVIAGAQYSFDMISAKKKKAPANGEIVLKLNPHDVQAQVGFGFDFYCTYFKFSTELKMSFGLMNMLVKEPNIYASNITSLKVKTIQVSFIFE